MDTVVIRSFRPLHKAIFVVCKKDVLKPKPVSKRPQMLGIPVTQGRLQAELVYPIGFDRCRWKPRCHRPIRMKCKPTQHLCRQRGLRYRDPSNIAIVRGRDVKPQIQLPPTEVPCKHLGRKQATPKDQPQTPRRLHPTPPPKRRKKINGRVELSKREGSLAAIPTAFLRLDLFGFFEKIAVLFSKVVEFFLQLRSVALQGFKLLLSRPCRIHRIKVLAR